MSLVLYAAKQPRLPLKASLLAIAWHRLLRVKPRRQLLQLSPAFTWLPVPLALCFFKQFDIVIQG